MAGINLIQQCVNNVKFFKNQSGLIVPSRFSLFFLLGKPDNASLSEFAVIVRVLALDTLITKPGFILHTDIICLHLGMPDTFSHKTEYKSPGRLNGYS